MVDDAVEYELSPLDIPSSDAISLDEVAHVDSVALFVDRARMVDSSFSLTPANVEAVVQIVRQLDGVPAAIEIVAGSTGAASTS